MNEREGVVSGEGTKGGRVVGHTKSGKPIYASAHDRRHRSFTPEDHEDAHRLTGDKLHLEAARAKRDAAKTWAAINKYHPDKIKSLEGTDMSKGIRTTQRSLIDQDDRADQEISKAIKEGKVSSQSLRSAGDGDSPRERLERSIAPESTDIRKGNLTERERAAIRKSYGDENLKDTHGEQFHSDNDREVEKLVTTIDEVKPFGEDGEDGTAEEDTKKKKAKKSMEPDRATLLSKALAEDTPKSVSKSSASEDDEDPLDYVIKAIQAIKAPAQAPMTASPPALISPKKQKSEEPDLKKKLPTKFAKKSFIKSMGPGGIIFDFGPLTGNAMADQATKLINQNADPIQRSNAEYQENAYGKALKEYVEKGDSYKAEPFGNIKQDLDKGMDQQVREQHEKEMAQKTGPAVKGSFNKSQINLGGEDIVATSETDAAIIEQMRAEGHGAQADGGFMVDATGGANAPIPDATNPIPDIEDKK